MTAPHSRGSLVLGVRDTRRLAAVALARLHGLRAVPELEAVVDTLVAGCSVPGAAVTLVAPGVQSNLAEVGLDAPRTVVDDDLSLAAGIVEAGRPLAIADLRQHPVYWQNPLVQRGRVVAFAAEPLVEDGVVLGAVSIVDSQPREFSERQLAVLRHQAWLAGSVLELHRGARADSGRASRRRSALDARDAARIEEEAGTRLSGGPTADADLALLGQVLASGADADAGDGLLDGLG